MIGELGRRQRMKFRCQQFGVIAGDAKDHERAGVPEHRGANLRTDLFEVLICDAKMRPEFARLRKQRRECVGAKALKLVDMDEERCTIFGRL